MSTRVLLDTDIGSDIDDAVCLAYLLAQPSCELLGITTVTGESDKRAMLASAMCKAAGQRVPIVPGVEQPLLMAPRQHTAPQATALRDLDHDTEFPDKSGAISFLSQTIRRYPGEVILLGIGPLTNIGLLFATDREAPRLLKGLVMMAGSFFHDPSTHLREGNADSDAHATAIVYGSAVNMHRSIGLDVTQKVRMDAGSVRRLFDTALLRPVLELAEVWFHEQDEIVFHDPLAAATLFDEEICKFQTGAVDVELENYALRASVNRLMAVERGAPPIGSVSTLPGSASSR